jgi:ABC-type multidrug transport system fused ATPase/permease subunit
LNKGAGAGERLFKLMDEPSAIESTIGRSIDLKGNIKFDSVSFAYPTRPDQHILKDLTFSLIQGETIAIVGHSGSGKSTIAQLLMRFYDTDSGTIIIDSIPIKELNPHYVREHVIGFVSQEPVLFGTSIMENIRYGRPESTDEEVIEAAKQANAHDFINIFPDGYQTNVGDRGRAISGGQKQRIAIARALLKNPSILILDEATSALDTASEILVQEALERLIKGRTVITIAHRLSTIQKADRIFMLSKGKIIESGSFGELIAKNGAFAALVGETDE